MWWMVSGNILGVVKGDSRSLNSNELGFRAAVKIMVFSFLLGRVDWADKGLDQSRGTRMCVAAVLHFWKEFRLSWGQSASRGEAACFSLHRPHAPQTGVMRLGLTRNTFFTRPDPKHEAPLKDLRKHYICAPLLKRPSLN